jgi:dienelactone hydrolase
VARILGLVILATGSVLAGPVKTVHFESEDHQTKLVGYLFEPEVGGRHPAVVLLHGRAGAYSSLAKGVDTAGGARRV